ncbi:agmatinase [Candidatus Woesearchaeota archaeon]|nr:agmatinase [Candidatus Woesearchaeota archaeon]
MNPHFSSPFNFGAIPREFSDYRKSRVAILPVPYDSTTSYRPGTRDGPHAIIAASRSMELYDEKARANFSEMGICTLDELDIVTDPERMVGRVYEAARQVLSDGKFLVMLGGEHSLSFGTSKALKEAYPDLSVLHIDAHGDMREENGGSRFDHGCVARRISEICPVVQVGIRSLSGEEADFISMSGHRVFYAYDIAQDTDGKWMEEAIGALSGSVYVTIDLDALDTGIMPSVGTPEPGGLQWYTLLRLMERLSQRKNVVGFDVVELAPQPGNVAPDFTAAKLVYKLIGFFCR